MGRGRIPSGETISTCLLHMQADQRPDCQAGSVGVPGFSAGAKHRAHEVEATANAVRAGVSEV